MTPQQLIRTATRHQVFLEGLKARTAQEFASVFVTIDDLLAKTLRKLRVDKLSDLDRKQLDALVDNLAGQQQQALDKQMEVFLDQVPEIAQYEAEFEARNIRSVLRKKERDRIGAPSPAKVAKEAMRRPIQATGDVLENVVADFSRDAIKRVNNTIRIAYDQGKTVPEAVRELIGTESLRFKDGVTQVSRRHATTVVRTGVQHVANTAREVTYEENDDVVVGVRWVSTLDGRTTTQCRSLDGHKFPINEGPRPPIHPNCRSTTAPDLSEEFDFLDEGATRSSKDGYVDADLTYYEWLQRQPEAFQDEVLGSVRGKLLRDGGLTAEKFAALQLDKNFKPISLAEMKQLEPLAFERAGLLEPFDLLSEIPATSNPPPLQGRPGAGTATGKVWEIGDELRAKHGRLPTREEMLVAAQAHGINPSTVSVQFGKWKKAVAIQQGGGALVVPPPTLVPELTKAVVAIPPPQPPPFTPPAPAPTPAPTVAQPTAQEKWDKMKASLETLKVKQLEQKRARELTRERERSLRALKEFEERYGDENKVINVDAMTDPEVRQQYFYALGVVKDTSAEDLAALSLGETPADPRTLIHDMMHEHVGASRSQVFHTPKDMPSSMERRVKEATAFVDKVVHESLRRTPMTIRRQDIQAAGVGAFYRRSERTAYVRALSPAAEIIHEMTHHFEYEGDSAGKAVVFLQNRRKFEPLKTATNGYKYFDDEWVKRGGRTYTSRVYEEKGYNSKLGKKTINIRATEALTTGAERLFEDPLEFYIKDPEHFEFTVRTLLKLH